MSASAAVILMIVGLAAVILTMIFTPPVKRMSNLEKLFTHIFRRGCLFGYNYILKYEVDGMIPASKVRQLIEHIHQMENEKESGNNINTVLNSPKTVQD